MKLSSSGLTFIKNHETYGGNPDLTVYKDEAGKLTVGYGHKVLSSDNLKLGDSITDSKATEFLKADLKKAENAVNTLPQIKSMKQCQYDAVVSLVYNVGTNPVKDSDNDLYKALNDSNTYLNHISTSCKNAVIKGFTYTKVNGIRNAGLVNRRNAELNEFFDTDDIEYISMT